MFRKEIIFISGSPRSGTSMIAKIIDSHPQVALLMENVFENRQRHWRKNTFWNDDHSLQEKIKSVYEKFTEPILGNKIITPDVWAVEDIYRFCTFFKTYKIIFLVRDPVAVVNSRLAREPEDFYLEFNDEARKHMLLDFSNRINVYLSSWRQSIENYWRLKDALKTEIHLIYYEDFCNNYSHQLIQLFEFLKLDITPEVQNWFRYSHHDSSGLLIHDLKYTDAPVFNVPSCIEIPFQLQDQITSVGKHYDCWLKRKI